MTKKLVIMLIIILLLSILVIIKNQQNKSPKEILIPTLLPENFNIADVQKLEFYAGKNPMPPVILTRQSDGWAVTSAFQVPADETKIQDFLHALANCAIEVRYTNKKFWQDFGVQDEIGLHLKIHHLVKNDNNAKEETQIIHLIVGKSDPGKTCFVRHSDQENVLTIPIQIRDEIGMYSEEEDKLPESSPWIQKQLLQLDKSKIMGASIQYPDKKIAFARQPPEENNPPATPNGSKTPETSTPANPDNPPAPDKPATPDSPAAEPKPAAPTWKLVEGGVSGKELKQQEVEQLLDSLHSVEIVDAVNPENKEKWGLQPPGFRMEILLNDGTKTVLCAGRPDLSQDGYCYLESHPQFIYQLPQWRFEQLFKYGSRWFDLPSYRPDTSQIKSIELKTDKGTVVMNRAETQINDKKQVFWILVQPANTDQTIQKEVADDIISQLQIWQMADYTDESDLAKLGLNPPEKQLTVTLSDDSQHVFRFGKPSRSIAGVYVTMDNIPIVGVTPKTLLSRLLPSLDQLVPPPAPKTPETPTNPPTTPTTPGIPTTPETPTTPTTPGTPTTPETPTSPSQPTDSSTNDPVDAMFPPVIPPK